MTNFIQKAIKHPGALHAQLGVPKVKTIPKEVISRIAASKVGQTVDVMGKKVKVTALLKKRVNLAKTLSHLG